MKQLIEDIKASIEMYFDKKLDDVDIPQQLDGQLWEMVANLIDDISDIVEETNNDIDYEIENFEEERKAKRNEIEDDWRAREEELREIASHDYLTCYGR